MNTLIFFISIAAMALSLGVIIFILSKLYKNHYKREMPF